MISHVTRAAFALLVVAIAAASVDARAPYDKRDRAISGQAQKVSQFALPGAPTRERMSMVAPGDLDEATLAQERLNAVPLGMINPIARSSSPGATVITSYMDDQYRPDTKGRQIDFRDSLDIHFVYNKANTAGATSEIGHNQWDPVPAHGTGCLYLYGGVGQTLTTTGEQGRWPKVDVIGGAVVISGADNPDGVSPNENTVYTEGGSMPPAYQTNFFGAPNFVPAATYGPLLNFLPTTKRAPHTVIELQKVGATIVTHLLLAVDSIATGGTFGDLRRAECLYFRRVDNGPWTSGINIDTVSFGFGGSMTASRISQKVAIAYTKGHALSVVNDQRYDNEVFYRVSTDAGASWGPKTNLTNYSRVTASNAAFLETHSLYDTDDNLHVIWTASLTPENVYSNTTYFWGDFSNSLYHWSSGTGLISRIHNADWGIEQNTQVCGFGSPGTGYLGFFSISECDNRLYAIFTQYLNYFGNYGQTSQIDDCASGGFSSRLYAANGEILVSVSSDKTGLLWDAARNLTSTYTPNCDSATGGGTCQNDTRATMSRYGMNVTGLCFPQGELLGTDQFNLFVQYTEDQFPGPGWRGAATFGTLTPNPIKWARLACVDPVVAPQIFTSPKTAGYPDDRVKPGASTSKTITVRNDGNATLTVSAINSVKLTQIGTSWLSTSVASLSVPAGVGNTATFNININASSFLTGTTTLLSGTVELVSDAANRPKDTIFVDYIATDTVVDVTWDTVSTANGTVQFATGKVSMTISNHGSAGRAGLGRVNLDFAANGGGVECDTTAEVYYYDGAPLVVRRFGPGNYSFSSSIFQQNFGTDVSFKPLQTGGPLKQGVTANYDSAYTGHFVNEDTTVRIEKTYYAPRTGGDNADYVIIKTVFTALGANVPNLLLGEMVDWDIPSDGGATNKSGVDGTTVFQRGTDTGAATPCQSKARYGATSFLGMYDQTTFGGNSCANDQTRYGQFSRPNDPYVFDAENGVYDPDTLWTIAGAINGASASTDSTDLHTVMTYKYNYTLQNGNPLTVYTVATTVRQGTQADLAANIESAKTFYGAVLRPGCPGLFGCCVGTTGNVDDVGNVDIADLTFLVDHLFINNPPVACQAEANVDAVGNVDIADLTFLVDHLFINNPPLPACP